MNISFQVQRGERIALLGANGSGKSTLLHLLNGLYFPSSGKIQILGKDITEDNLELTDFGPVFRKEVGFLFQNSDAQLFCPTVYDELAFGPLQLRLEHHEVKERVNSILKLLDITHLSSRSPQSLSAGQKKMAALASLLVLNPSILLMDEPSAGLDPRSQALLLDILEGLHDRGATLITATHDLSLLPYLSDRALVLGEDHQVHADENIKTIMENEELLVRSNLINDKIGLFRANTHYS
jgi:cobalt/nickel transport system ATP-binding protein